MKTFLQFLGEMKPNYGAKRPKGIRPPAYLRADGKEFKKLPKKKRDWTPEEEKNHRDYEATGIDNTGGTVYRR